MEETKANHPLNILSPEEEATPPWYAKGLRFKCTECGKCCTGGPGYAWVDDQEIQAMADYLKITPKDFGKKYLRFVQGRYSLIEKRNYDCIFLKDKKCTIYPVRPQQCRTFPWWAQNLSSPEAWEEAAQDCEGISKDAPVVPLTTIQSQLMIDKKSL
jgi:Fe-S-cluster containining protein